MDTAEEPVNITGHLMARTAQDFHTMVTIAPNHSTIAKQTDGDASQEEQNTTFDLVNLSPDRLPCAYPPNPTPFMNRSALPYEPNGYVYIGPREDQDWKVTRDDYIRQYEDKYNYNELTDEQKTELYNSPVGNEIFLAEKQAAPFDLKTDFVSDTTFKQIVDGFKNEDGKFLAMTAYGAVPLPDQMIQNIPDKFVTKPLIQEREIFVLKQEHETRVTEKDYTQFNHQFTPIDKHLKIDKIKPMEDVKIIEVPHFKYTAVVEEKIVDIPLGIKYVEIPIEVTCQMPPRIVPVPKPHIVERIIESTKPVVQEKIIEVPEIVKKKVPRIVTKEIPYVVAKYVEKIVEVPYNSGQELPRPKGRPMSVIPKPPILPSILNAEKNQTSRNPTPLAPTPIQTEGRVEGSILIVDNKASAKVPQTFYVSPGIQHIKLPYEAQIDVSIVQENEIPPGVAIAQKDVRYMAPGSRAMAYGEQPQYMPNTLKDKNEPIYAGPMDPIIEHAAPGMRAVDFKTPKEEPDILTQQGVLKYSKFECCLREDVSQLLPNLPHHDLVPMDPIGTPSLKGLAYVHSQYAQRMQTKFPSQTKKN